MKKIILLSFISLFFTSCDYVLEKLDKELERNAKERQLEHKRKAKELKKKIENKTIKSYIKELKIKPNINHADFNTLTQEFKQQNYRFEFNEHNFSFNSKSFFLRDDFKQIISVFGKPDRNVKVVSYSYPKGKIKCFEDTFVKGKLNISIYDYPDSIEYGNDLLVKNYKYEALLRLTQNQLKRKQEDVLKKLQKKYGDSLVKISDKIKLTYKTLKVDLEFDKEESTNRYVLSEFLIHFKPIKSYLKPKFNIVMFRGIPYQFSMKMYDFLELSNLTRDDLDYHRLYIYQKGCLMPDKNVIYTKIESKPYFEYISAGHLGMTGPYDPEKSRSIDYIVFSLKNLADLKYSEMKKHNLLELD